VAAGQIIDEDSELALQHAIAARRLASRIAVVREAVGLAAYAVGDWTTAIAELRTYHRMTGRQTHLAELADCERALGRPERAIDLFRGADKETLDKAGAIELLIVAAGARGDLGQHDAAVAMLQVRELTVDEDADWAVRLRYAYADALLAAGRRDEAREWFARAAAADEEHLTDAAERLLELDGVTIEGDDEDEDDESGETPVAETDADEDDDEDEDEDEESGQKLVAETDDEDESGESLAAPQDVEPVTLAADEENEEYTDEAFLDDEEDADEDADQDADQDDLVEDVDAGVDGPEDKVAQDDAAEGKAVEGKADVEQGKADADGTAGLTEVKPADSDIEAQAADVEVTDKDSKA
jgi:tetratricopeptide (TPR) repeat protein